MVTDTEAPTAPLTWAESIHGDLVLVDRLRADGWEQLERGMETPTATTIIDGVLSTIERGAGTSLLLHTPAGPSFTAAVSVEGGPVLIVTHLGGSGSEEALEAARQIPDEAYVATDATFTVGYVGGVLFDGSASWEMASESMLYVYVQAKGEYRVDVVAEHGEGERRVRVIRLRAAG
jgi:hypothetical protein